MKYSIIVLTGGYGTRISGILKGIPKIMAPIRGIPFVDYYIEWLQKISCHKSDIIFCAGYRGEVLKSYLTKKDAGIKILIEDKPLGTSNAVAMSIEHIEDEHIVVLNGDTVFGFDIDDMISVYVQYKCKRTVLGLTKKSCGESLGGYNIRHNKAIYADSGAPYMSLGAFVTSKRQFLSTCLRSECHAGTAGNLDETFLKSVKPYPLVLEPTYFIDIGTPQSFEKAQTLIPYIKLRGYC